MDAGIAQENGALQNITLQINPGEVFVVPQGLLHYNHNRQCIPNAFFQTFNSADPGALTVTSALKALNDSGEAGAAAALASTTDQVMAGIANGAFALDQACLKECGFPEEGAEDPFKDLPDDIKVLFGI
jgi:Cupin